jgi:hypothetical protein
MVGWKEYVLVEKKVSCWVSVKAWNWDTKMVVTMESLMGMNSVVSMVEN